MTMTRLGLGDVHRASKPLDTLYFEWLMSFFKGWYGRVFLPEEDQFKMLFSNRFEYYVANDQNRSTDGEVFRERFLLEEGLSYSGTELDEWLSLDCSVLEMLMALAERIAYQTQNEMVPWFALMVHNLNLGHTRRQTKAAIDCLNKRLYFDDGSQGLFPLRYPAEDQRSVEIWYQMQAYLIEGQYENDFKEVWC